MTDNPPLLEMNDLVVEYRIHDRKAPKASTAVRAVAGVSLKIPQGRTLGLVGESGSGKTTLGQAALGLVKPTEGVVQYRGEDLQRLRGERRRAFRRNAQIIFQNPYQSLNPRMRVAAMLTEPMIVHGLLKSSDALARASELLQLVGLNPAHMDRYPHEFSGGQRQRLSIARALTLEPEFLVCDEPTSALDVSIRAQILNLLSDLRDRLGLTYMLVTHDLSIVSIMSRDLAVMYLGRIVEIGQTHEVYAEPRHPYTTALLSAEPSIYSQTSKRLLLVGEVPSPARRPSGCGFRPRCWLYEKLGRPTECKTTDPELRPVSTASSRQVACHFSSALPVTIGEATAPRS